MSSSTIVPFNMYEAQNAYKRLQFCLSTDSPETAITEIKTFLKIFPDVALAHNDLGVLYHRAGERLLALANYEKANRLQPDTPCIIKNLAEFYAVELGWLDDAIMMLTGALNQNPQDTEVLISLGIISMQVSRPDEARTFFRKALDIDPANSAVREELAKLDGPVSAAEYRGDLNVSAQTPPPYATTTPYEPPQSTASLYQKANEAIASGKEIRAIALLEQLLSQDPNCATAHNDLGVLYLKGDKPEKARHHHESATRLDPNNPVFRKNLADLYYAVFGMVDEAVEIYTALLKETPQDTELLTTLAIVSKAFNLAEQAGIFINRVLDLEPWNSEARQFLAGLQG